MPVLYNLSNAKSALDSLRSETEKQAHARQRLVAEIKRDIEVSPMRWIAEPQQAHERRSLL